VIAGRGATISYVQGPLTLYLAGRATEAVDIAIPAADMARSARDATLIMFSLPHLGLSHSGVGRYGAAASASTRRDSSAASTA
jgi:hypothetical protein